MKCPSCNSPIENENIKADVAQCTKCSTIFKISENLETENEGGFDIDTPPKGAWIKKELNHIVIGASTRSPIAFFLVPFMFIWSGGSLDGIYEHN